MITMTGIASPDSFLEGGLAYESNMPDRKWGGGESLPFPFLLACWPGVIFFAFSRRAKANAMWARSARQPSPVVRVSCLPGAPRSLCACLRSPINNVRPSGYVSFLFLVTPARTHSLSSGIAEGERFACACEYRLARLNRLSQLYIKAKIIPSPQS